MDQMNRQARPHELGRGFTLFELLCVMTILTILLAVTLPSLDSVMKGSKLNRAGVLMADSLSLARQEAVTRNREVEVRFYNFASPQMQGWRGFQIFRVEQTASGRTVVATSPVKLLPEGTEITADTSFSPILFADATVGGSTTLPSSGAATYTGFRFRPNGSTSGDINATNNFLTLQNSQGTKPPADGYYTLQINTVTGKVNAFTP